MFQRALIILLSFEINRVKNDILTDLGFFYIILFEFYLLLANKERVFVLCLAITTQSIKMLQT